MEKKYEVPQLTLIGQASEVVQGSGLPGIDLPGNTAGDFEFEQD